MRLRKILSLALALMLVVGLLPTVGAKAADELTATFDFDENTNPDRETDYPIVDGDDASSTLDKAMTATVDEITLTAKDAGADCGWYTIEGLEHGTGSLDIGGVDSEFTLTCSEGYTITGVVISLYDWSGCYWGFVHYYDDEAGDVYENGYTLDVTEDTAATLVMSADHSTESYTAPQGVAVNQVTISAEESIQSPAITAITVTYELLGPIFDDRFGGKINEDGTGKGYTAYTNYVEGTEYKVHDDVKYTFAGWYDDVDGAGAKLADDPVAGTTYYAKWTKDGKTVVSQPLTFDVDATEDMDKADEFGYQWDKAEATLTLSGMILDLGGQTVTGDEAMLSAVALNLDGRGSHKIVLEKDTENYIYGENILADGMVMTDALTAANDLDISGEGSLTVIGGKATKTLVDTWDMAMSRALVANGSITSTANVTVIAGAVSADEGFAYQYAVSAYDLTVNDGVFTAVSDFKDQGAVFDRCDVFAGGARVRANLLADGTGTGAEVVNAVIDSKTGALTGVDDARYVKIYCKVSAAAVARLDAENVPDEFALQISGVNVNGIKAVKSGKGFKLMANDQYLKLAGRQLVCATETTATVWYYNGGLYTLVGCGGAKTGFFRAQRFIRCYLAADQLGMAYARLLYAPVMAVYDGEVFEEDCISLTYTDSTTIKGLLKKHTYIFTIHAPETAKVYYSVGSAKSFGTTFTMQYKPAYVNITVVDGEVTTVWQAKLTRTGYEMSIVE